MYSEKILNEERKYLEVKKSQISGKGLFAKKDIEQGDIVCTYMGERISNDEAWRRIEAGIDQFIVETYNDGLLDSMPIFCHAMYANDAMGLTRVEGLKNNAQIEIIRRAPRIVATRDIKKGEEIFVAYGRGYWKNVEKRIKKQAKSK